MRRRTLGVAANELYTQFMYQAGEMATRYGYKRHVVAAFTKSKWLNGPRFSRFYDLWVGERVPLCTWMFPAKRFSGISAKWGVLFSVWGSGYHAPLERIVLKDIVDGDIEVVGERSHRRVERRATDWVVEGDTAWSAGRDCRDCIKVTSALRVREDRGDLGVPRNTMISLTGSSNAVSGARRVTALISCRSAICCTRNISVTNGSIWDRVIALFGARTTVKNAWFNEDIEFLAPDTSGDGYASWLADCHVFAIMSPSNNCVALRDVSYKDSLWNLSNHTFWKTRESVLASTTGHVRADCEEYPCRDVYGEDVACSPDPYMAVCLEHIRHVLGPEAARVMELLDALWTDTIDAREDLPWDAGVYQLKRVWKVTHKDRWKELEKAYRALKDRIERGVSEYGFLPSVTVCGRT
jgi:hypothetical protein